MKIMTSICVAALGLIIGGVFGVFFARASDGVEGSEPLNAPDVFAQARERLEKILETEPLSQFEMTMASAEIYRLSEAEIAWLECDVANSPGFSEAKYTRDREAWQTRLDDALNGASDYEGGTMEHTDRALRATELHMERIRTLRDELSQMNK